jgi:hypothetical protein
MVTLFNSAVERLFMFSKTGSKPTRIKRSRAERAGVVRRIRARKKRMQIRSG